MGNDPVNAIVHGQSAQATAALDSPAADAVFVAAAAAPVADPAVNGSANGDGAGRTGDGADGRVAVGAGDADAGDSDGLTAGVADPADTDLDDLDDLDAGHYAEPGTAANPLAVTAAIPVIDDAGTNFDVEGEPPDTVARPTEVTETLAASALVSDVRPAASAWDADRVVTEIYHGEYKSLVRLAVLLVHDVPTAEEVVQDAFEAMHTAWRRLREKEKALSYLRQAVVNRSRSVLRHRTVVDRNAPKPAPDEPSAEHGALALIERSAVIAALRTLPDRQREAVVLRYYADLSEADIAATMGISRGAVKSHTARAMAALKSILELETS